MTISVAVSFKKSVSAKASRQAAYDLVSNVPRSASHIPELVSCVEVKGVSDKPVYDFQYQTVGLDRWSDTPWHHSEFDLYPERWEIEWHTMPDKGNVDQDGHWLVEGDDSSATLHLTLNGAMILPVPRIAKAVATPVVTKLFVSRMDQYLDNLVATLNKEA